MHRFVDHDMFMHLRGGGIGHKVTWNWNELLEEDHDIVQEGDLDSDVEMDSEEDEDQSSSSGEEEDSAKELQEDEEWEDEGLLAWYRLMKGKDDESDVDGGVNSEEESEGDMDNHHEYGDELEYDQYGNHGYGAL